MGIYRPCLALWFHFYNSPTMPVRQWNIYRFLVSSQQKLHNWAKFQRERDGEKTKNRQTKKSKKYDRIKTKKNFIRCLDAIWKPKSYKQCLYTRTSPRISPFLENYIKRNLKLRTFIKFYFRDSWNNGTVICFNGVETRKSKKHNPLKIFGYNIKMQN